MPAIITLYTYYYTRVDSFLFGAGHHPFPPEPLPGDLDGR